MVQGNSTHPVYEFGPFRLEESEFRLLRDGRPVPLKGKTFQLLLLLVQNAGHVLTKPELMTHLWPDNFVEDHNLAVQISDLRNALGREYQYIVTVSRYGYRFTPTVTKHEQASERSGEGAAVGCFHDGRPRELFTLAVLPFKIIGGSTEDAYLELGVADALITRLSTLKHVIVRPTSAIRRYAGYADAITAGQALKVKLVIEGSIQRIRESVRITVQLINVSDGSALWAGKYDGSCSDILGLEDYVTEQVAAALALELTLGETRRLMNRQTESVEAHTAYMKGYFYWGKRTRGHSPEVKRSMEYFSRAIEIDPEYAAAYVGLGRAIISLYSFNSLAFKEEYPQIEALLDKAIELDHQLAEAHSIKAMLRLFIHLDWAGAEREHQAAINTGQHCVFAYDAYSTFLAHLGRFEDALALNSSARALDPTSIVYRASRCRILFLARQHERCVSELTEAIELESDYLALYFMLGANYDQLGEYDQAHAAYSRYLSVDPENSELLAALCRNLALAGKHDQAREILDQVIEMSHKKFVPGTFIAMSYLALGETEKCLTWLEQAFSDSDAELCILGIDPRFDAARHEPRFLGVLDAVMRTATITASQSLSPIGSD